MGLQKRGTRVHEATELSVKGIEAFFEKTVSRFGSGAKIDCPKQYLGRSVYVVVRRPRKGDREDAGEGEGAGSGQS